MVVLFEHARLRVERRAEAMDHDPETVAEDRVGHFAAEDQDDLVTVLPLGYRWRSPAESCIMLF